MPGRKLIGLTGPSSFSQECKDVIEEFLEANYVTIDHGAEENVNYWMKEVDGVILAGGVDIHPSIYGHSLWNGYNLSKFDTKRDLRELMIVEHCLNTKKPMLGICRGHQIIGLVKGIKIVMDLSDSPYIHQAQKQNIQVSPKEPVHFVKIINKDFYGNKFKMPRETSERKILRSVLGDDSGGKDKIFVNSFHHQGLEYDSRKNAGVDVIGIGPVDIKDCKEIIELMAGDGENWISCQWHPEFDWKDNTASRVVLNRFKSMVNGEF